MSYLITVIDRSNGDITDGSELATVIKVLVLQPEEIPYESPGKTWKQTHCL